MARRENRGRSLPTSTALFHVKHSLYYSQMRLGRFHQAVELHLTEAVDLCRSVPEPEQEEPSAIAKEMTRHLEERGIDFHRPDGDKIRRGAKRCLFCKFLKPNVLDCGARQAQGPNGLAQERRLLNIRIDLREFDLRARKLHLDRP